MAVKFTRSGRVVFRSSYSGEMARFEVEDTGPGMSETELQRVFEPAGEGDEDLKLVEQAASRACVTESCNESWVAMSMLGRPRCVARLGVLGWPR